MRVDAALLQSSVLHLLSRRELFTTTFYAELFRTMPHIRVLFARTDFNEQRLHFVRALEIIASLSQDNDKLIPFAKAAGAKHVLYGVSPYDLSAVIPVLLHVMADVMDPAIWTDAHYEAWANALQTVVSAMRDGAMSVAIDQQWDDEVSPTQTIQVAKSQNASTPCAAEQAKSEEPSVDIVCRKVLGSNDSAIDEGRVIRLELDAFGANPPPPVLGVKKSYSIDARNLR